MINGVNFCAGRDCFVVCKGCYDNPPKECLIPRADIINFLERATRDYGLNKITMSGGDPLTRPDIIELLKEVKKLGYYIRLDTVGTPILGEARVIKGGRYNIPQIDVDELNSCVDNIGIPLDGSSNEVMGKFRFGIPRIFDQQLAIIERLIKSGTNLTINTVAHSQNIDDIENMLPIINGFKTPLMWQIFQFRPTGILGFLNRKLFEVEDTDFETLRSDIIRKQQTYFGNAQVHFKSNIGRTGIYTLIDPTGKVYTPAKQGKDITIIGDIRNPSDYETIMELIMKSVEVRKRKQEEHEL